MQTNKNDLLDEDLEEIDIRREEHRERPDYKARRRQEKEKENEKETSFAQELLQMSIYILIVLCLTFLVINYVGQRTKVSGESMMPTLQNGNNLIVDKLTYRFSDPKRFDIIVFPYELKKDTYYIKRIIGLPGETVRIDSEGTIYINGEALEEDYGMEVIRDPGRAGTELTLAADEYFVMGDNRNNSSDSRDPSVGNVKRSRIIGKAWLRIWPLNELGFLKHQ